MKAVVKVAWKTGKKPRLKLATEDGYDRIELGRGRELDLELVDQRRCVGYHSEPGNMKLCPGFREIESGDQCPECRGKDIYGSWRTGESSPDFEADYSVYLVQAGEEVKVGVTKTSRLRERWLEQGADYAAELENRLTGEEALKREEEISGRGIPERIRKEKKVRDADNRILKQKLEELGYGDRKIRKVAPNALECSRVVREGVFPSPIRAVKGQIVSNGRIGLALTSGKVLKKREQQDLSAF